MKNFPEPFFLQSHAGNLFALFQPAEGQSRGSLLYVPPFAEEMNRCRHIVAEQTRALAKQGYASLILDLYGTGDSVGEYTEASWSIWVQNIQCAADWLESKTQTQVMLWGLRLGALLAANVANTDPQRFARLLLWQPVLDGKLFLTQYMRLRIAFLMDNNLPPETTDGMRQAIHSGGILEVAGYPLSNPLFADIDQKRFGDLTGLARTHIDWFEHVVEAGKPPTIATKRAIDQLSAAGGEVNLHAFTGPPMWQLHKRDDIPDLVSQTTQLFGIAS